LAVEEDGAIKMDAQDIGPTVTQICGDDDYEFWVRVPSASCPSSPSNCCARSSWANWAPLMHSGTGARRTASSTNLIPGFEAFALWPVKSARHRIDERPGISKCLKRDAVDLMQARKAAHERRCARPGVTSNHAADDAIGSNSAGSAPLIHTCA